MSELNSKVLSATKWSAITEILGKLVSPITTMVLARILTPDAYGVVATIAMIISFSEIFSEAGFSRYIIQHEFKNEEDKYKSANVAFTTNLVLSLILWTIIIVFSAPLAELVGNPGLGVVIAVACVSIPIHSFSTIQRALYQRDFDFKTLFYARVAGILIPFVVTIPLAFYFRNYWALIIGTIVVNVANALILTICSRWKPSVTYFSFTRLKVMLAFSMWIVLDTILIWFTEYIDIFLVGRYLDEYYLGLYKTSTNLVGQIVALITAAVLPVMLPTLSRLQNDKEQMRAMVLKFQKMVGIILLPMGVGIFVFSDLIVEIMLGPQWLEASGFVGLWGLMSAITIIFSRFCSHIYPAMGKPRLSVLAQILHLVALVPAVVISVHYGFETLYVTRSLIRIEGILVNLVIAYCLIRITFKHYTKNIYPEILSAMVMGVCAYSLLQISDNLLASLLWVSISIIIYFAVLQMFPGEKKLMLDLKRKLKK